MVKIVLLALLLVGCATSHKVDQHGKMMFYKAPEEIWPDDFKPAPQVCGSPFTGKLIAR